LASPPRPLKRPARTVPNGHRWILAVAFFMEILFFFPALIAHRAATATVLYRIIRDEPAQGPGVQAAARSTLAALLEPSDDMPEPLRADTLATRERLRRLAE
jgi:hypothetical protein